MKRSSKDEKSKMNNRTRSDDNLTEAHSRSNMLLFTSTVGSLSSLLLLLHVPPHLQPQTDSFGDCRLWKRGLHHRHQLTGQRASLRPNQIALLLHSGNDGKVEGEVGGDDAPDSLLAELLLTF